MSTRHIGRLAVEIDGDGPALIMVHGLGGTSNTWTPQVGALSGRFRIVRPDLPGSGRSAAGERISIAGFVDALIGLLDALDTEKAHFAGHSLGTIVCQHLAVDHPDRILSLALAGPLLAPPDTARDGLKARAAKARDEGMADIAEAIVQGSTSATTRRERLAAAAFVRESLMRQPAEGYARTCEALAAAEAAAVERIQVPTLLLTGDEDPVAPTSVARGMVERMPAARLRTFSRCGHWIPIECPQDTNTAMKDFYDTQPSRIG